MNATNTTSGNIELNNSEGLTVMGISQSGGGAVTVFTSSGAISVMGMSQSGAGAVTMTAAAGAISLMGAVGAGSGAINLDAAASLTETGNGSLSTTGTLTTASSTGAVLDGANTVSVFNGSNTTSGDMDLADTVSPLTVTGSPRRVVDRSRSITRAGVRSRSPEP